MKASSNHEGRYQLNVRENLLSYMTFQVIQDGTGCLRSSEVSWQAPKWKVNSSTLKGFKYQHGDWSWVRAKAPSCTDILQQWFSSLAACSLLCKPGQELPGYNLKPASICRGQEETGENGGPLQIGRWQI